MIKNYFKLAIKVLGRHKFFTFISLFGISFTLMILMLVAAFLENELGNHSPMSKKDRMVFIPRVTLQLIQPDTLTSIDSTLLDGAMVYDTTYTYEDSPQWTSTGWPGVFLLQNYLADMTTAVRQSVFSASGSFDVFLNNNKLTLEVTYTDAPFWEIFDFRFVEGKPYGQTEVTNRQQVAVISRETARKYFGRDQEVLGEELELDGRSFRVVGLVEDSPTKQFNIATGVYMPYTNMKESFLTERENFQGPFNAVYLVDRPGQKEDLIREIERTVELIPLPKPEEYNHIEVTACTFNERYAQDIYYQEDPGKSKRIASIVLIGLLALFFMLPTLNLINLNVSRILERSSEIGVRKAFGAHSGNIMGQLLFENIILTILGGALGFILAFFLIRVINDSQVLPDTVLRFNGYVFLYSLLACLFFGLLSGIIPAYRMSKIQVVDALKQ